MPAWLTLTPFFRDLELRLRRIHFPKLRQRQKRHWNSTTHWPKRAYRERNQVFSIKVDPMLDDLRGNPRFEAIVQKVFAPKMAETESR
jgi:hypothetical protein